MPTCCGSSFMTPVFPNSIRLFFREDSFLFSLDGEFKVISSFSSGISKKTSKHTAGSPPSVPFQYHNLLQSCSSVESFLPFCSVSEVNLCEVHKSTEDPTNVGCPLQHSLLTTRNSIWSAKAVLKSWGSRSGEWVPSLEFFCRFVL